MKERIQILADEAFKGLGTNPVYATAMIYASKELEKFAELLIRECASRVDNILREKKDGGGTIGDEIREHFGVE